MGGLPPPRPDQLEEVTPRTTAPGQRILRLGGTPGSQSQLALPPQVATAFFTFPAAGRLFTAGIYLAGGTNNSYGTSVTQFYARLSTQSGIVLCSVQLAIAGPNQGQSGGDRFIAPAAGLPVAKGDKLLFDVNNNVGFGTTGLMRADCEIFYTIP